MKENELYISLTKNVDNLEFIDEESKSNPIDIVSEGDIILFFANLSDENRKTIIEKIEGIEADSINSFFDVCFDRLNNIIEKIYTQIILLDVVKKYSKRSKIDITKLKKALIKNLNDIYMMAKAYAMTVDTVTNREDKPRFLYAVVFDHIGSIHGDITYGFFPCKINNELSFVDVYTIRSSHAALIYDLIAIVKENKPFSKCVNCNKFFIPKNRSDEKYCNNIYKNGKTCKQYGYENKVNNNEYLKAYRTIYKTQNARKQRNLKNIKDIDIRFTSWADYAKTQLLHYQSNKLSIEEFKTSISGTEWLKGAGKNGEH